MSEIVIALVTFIETIGPNNVLILCVGGFLALVLLVYLFIVIESYTKYSNDKISFYSNFEVIIMHQDETEIKRIKVKAWGKVHAVEKAAKKLSDPKNLKFMVNKI